LHYVVEQSNDGGISYTVINNNVVGTTYAVTSGLSPATTYYFKVAAVDPAGNASPFSTAASATTQSAPDTTKPSVPTALATTVVSANEIDLSWSQSTDPDNAQSSLHYLVEESTDGTTYSVINNNIGSASCTPTCAYKVTGLSASTLYYFKVAAADPAANQSAYSSAASATTQSGGTPPPVPTGLTAIGVSGDDVHLSWNASTGAAGYDIYRNGVFRASVTSTSFEDSGLPFNSTNTYQVDAHDGSTPPATSALSSAVSATTLSSNCSIQTGAPSDPNPPSNGSLLPTASSSNLHLNGVVTGTNGSWCGEQDATGSHVMTFTYQWQKSSDGSTNWTNILNMARGINYTIMSGAIPYYLRLQVTANNGISPSAQQYSNVVGPTS
jgi:chitodextrinase